MTKAIKVKAFKATKSEKQDAIQSHFEVQGKRMTNLAKVKVEALDELIIKYDIDVETYVISKREVEAKQKKERDDREAVRDAEWKIVVAERMRMDTVWKDLSEQEKELCYKKYSVYYELCMRSWDWVNIEKETKKTIEFVDREVEILKRKDCRVERTGENTFTVDGICVIHNTITHKPKNADEMREFIKKEIKVFDMIHRYRSIKILVELIAEENKQKLLAKIANVEKKMEEKKLPTPRQQMKWWCDTWGETQRMITNEKYDLLVSILTDEQIKTLLER